MLDPITNLPLTEKGCSEPSSRYNKQPRVPPAQALPSLGALCSMNQAVQTLFLLVWKRLSLKKPGQDRCEVKQ